MSYEKRLIAIFRTFVEKALLPQLKRIEGASSKEWNKFNSMLSMDNLNYN